jgi:hypothetical protein
MQQGRLFTWLSFGSALPAKVAQFSVGANSKSATDRNNTIHTFTQAEADEFIKLSSRVDDEWVADMDKRGFKGAALLKSAKDLIAKHGKA